MVLILGSGIRVLIYSAILIFLPRVCKDGANVVIFNDWKNIGEIAKYAEGCGFIIKDMLRWQKDNPMPRNRDRRFVVDYEVAVWLVKPKGRWTFNRQNNNYDRPVFHHPVVGGKEKTFHPTQKPINLMLDLIKTLSNKGDTVLDCFVGSGSTAIASLKSGRNFVGCEKDFEYYELSLKRIRDMK